MLMKEKIDANKVTRKNHCLFPADESVILRSTCSEVEQEYDLGGVLMSDSISKSLVRTLDNKNSIAANFLLCKQ